MKGVKFSPFVESEKILYDGVRLASNAVGHDEGNVFDTINIDIDE